VSREFRLNVTLVQENLLSPATCSAVLELEQLHCDNGNLCVGWGSGDAESQYNFLGDMSSFSTATLKTTSEGL
jgi:hypothetical protein